MLGRTPDLVATTGNLQLATPHHMLPPHLLNQQMVKKQHFYLLASRQSHLQENFCGLLIHKDPLRRAVGTFAPPNFFPSALQIRGHSSVLKIFVIKLYIGIRGN